LSGALLVKTTVPLSWPTLLWIMGAPANLAGWPDFTGSAGRRACCAASSAAAAALRRVAPPSRGSPPRACALWPRMRAAAPRSGDRQQRGSLPGVVGDRAKAGLALGAVMVVRPRLLLEGERLIVEATEGSVIQVSHGSSPSEGLARHVSRACQPGRTPRQARCRPRRSSGRCTGAPGRMPT